jgi:hypothetical protein
LILKLNRKLSETIGREYVRLKDQASLLSEALKDIIRQEQDHEIDLKDALGLR